jgi:hypothetical protein
MRKWSFWDWLGYTGLAIAAVMVAADTGLRGATGSATRLTDLLNSPLWAFMPLALIVLASGILVLRAFNLIGRTQPAATTPTAISTRLRLQFNAGSDIPTSLDMENIWRWYTLTHIIVGKDRRGKQKEMRMVTIFIIFDKPVAFKQILLNSGGAALPRPEVKDSGPRHAVIVLGDAIPGVVLEITAAI